MRNRIYLDRNWFYHPVWDDAYISSPMVDGTPVTLPHTVAETPLHYFDESIYQKLVCYQTILNDCPDYQGKRLILTFRGAAHRATVYLNGEELGSHDCGYTSFSFDITGKLLPESDNLLTVKLDSRETLDQPPFGFVIDYMTYGGLYRDVFLTVKDSVSMTDIAIRPDYDGNVTTEGLSNDAIKDLEVAGRVETDLYLSRDAKQALKEGRLSIRQSLNADVILERNLSEGLLVPSVNLDQFLKGTEVPEHVTIVSDAGQVKLWDVESPETYSLVTELLYDNEPVDQSVKRIGFRKAEFRADGFYLNGRLLKIRGLNRHQSYPYVGYAMPQSMQRLDARILKKELGVNTVRTSHYPQSHDFIDECDRLGLLVFTEIPGWQHIGESTSWKDQAVQNVIDMITEYRNHPSIILWGVRINESKDDDELYTRTNGVAHAFDPSRQTGGVRCNTANKNTKILEDVFTYNDFSHSGGNAGCLPKEKATNDMNKGYLVTEFNGHMYPTKPFDWEEHQMEHTIRHATVLDAVAGTKGVAGGIGWCMFDYNTHKDFGSGDRICYHGVMDMFRNPKMATAVYEAEGLEETILHVTSSMDIGEHPASNRGDTWIISNADSVRMYKNGNLLKEYFPEDSKFKNLKHGPILIDDYVGNMLVTEEHMQPKQAKICKHALNKFSMTKGKIDLSMIWDAFRLVVIYHMDPANAVTLYQKYIGNWGGETQEYRFDAVKNGEVVRSVVKAPVRKIHIDAELSQKALIEDHTYDVAEIRVAVRDQDNNVLPFACDPMEIEVEGPLDLIGPHVIGLSGGQTGIYIKSKGLSGTGKVTLKYQGCEPVVLEIPVDVGD